MPDLIISGAEEMYRAFLRGIRAQHTGVVLPEYWNPFINEVQLNIVKKKLPLNEFDQKHIDDLNILRCVTDGDTLARSYTILSEASTGVYNIPVGDFTIPSNLTPITTVAGVIYPLYLHGISVMFKRSNVVADIWKPGYLLRSDTKGMIDNNPYRASSSTRIYYERVGNQIRRIGGDTAVPSYKMRLEYYRYPRVIYYDSNSEGAATYDPELGVSVNQEIVEEAIRVFLERKTDPRYKTYINEMIMGKQVN